MFENPTVQQLLHFSFGISNQVDSPTQNSPRDIFHAFTPVCLSVRLSRAPDTYIRMYLHTKMRKEKQKKVNCSVTIYALRTYRTIMYFYRSYGRTVSRTVLPTPTFCP